MMSLSNAGLTVLENNGQGECVRRIGVLTGNNPATTGGVQ
jgi:hypothetical protein